MIAMVVLNLWASAGWFYKKDIALGICFICYAVATAALLYKGLQ